MKEFNIKLTEIQLRELTRYVLGRSARGRQLVEIQTMLKALADQQGIDLDDRQPIQQADDVSGKEGQSYRITG